MHSLASLPSVKASKAFMDGSTSTSADPERERVRPSHVSLLGNWPDNGKDLFIRNLNASQQQILLSMYVDGLWSVAELIFNSILASFYLPNYMANPFKRTGLKSKATWKKKYLSPWSMMLTQRRRLKIIAKICWNNCSNFEYIELVEWCLLQYKLKSLISYWLI